MKNGNGYKISRCAIAVFAISGSSISFAGEFGLGLGVTQKQKEYRGFDTVTQIIPIIYYENSYIRVLGTNIDIKAGGTDNVNFAIRTKLALGDGYKEDESDFLTGMEERENSLWVGPAVEYETPFGELTTEFLFDALGKSEGYQANVGFSKEFHLSESFSIKPSVEVSWMSSDYVDYYYGVTEQEVLPDRAFYQGEATTNYEAKLDFKYRLTNHQQTWIGASYTGLGSSIKDSPIVDSSGESRIGIFYLYRM